MGENNAIVQINVAAMRATLSDSDLDQPPHLLDLAPSDFHLFLYVKRFLGGQRFQNHEKAIETTQKWFKMQTELPTVVELKNYEYL